MKNKLTFGQKMADKIAQFGGSWTFIFCFTSFLLTWMIYNAISKKAFDPYPYIFLNLFMSALAAVQAPIIMMSQNRAAEIDRQRAEDDYDINIKAEQEIREMIQLLHEKLDNLEKKEK